MSETGRDGSGMRQSGFLPMLVHPPGSSRNAISPSTDIKGLYDSKHHLPRNLQDFDIPNKYNNNMTSRRATSRYLGMNKFKRDVSLETDFGGGKQVESNKIRIKGRNSCLPNQPLKMSNYRAVENFRRSPPG